MKRAVAINSNRFLYGLIRLNVVYYEKKKESR